MTSGTKSVLFAEHNFIHSICIVLAWKKLYKKYPKLWQIMCIFLHDIGYLGKKFLEEKSNNDHELLGAKLCGFLFGKKGFDLVYHHRASNPPCSKLEAADDFSWCISPLWWLDLSYLIQKKITSPGREWKIRLCERWIRRFQGEEPSSLWDDAVKHFRY